MINGAEVPSTKHPVRRRIRQLRSGLQGLMRRAFSWLRRRPEVIVQSLPPGVADLFIHARERIDRPLDLDLTIPSWHVSEVLSDSWVVDSEHISPRLGFAWSDLHVWQLKGVTLDVDSSLVFSRDRVITQSGTGTRSSSDSAFVSGAYARYKKSDVEWIDHPFASVGDIRHHYHFVVETLPRMLRIQRIDPATSFYVSDEASTFASAAMTNLGLKVTYVPRGSLLTGSRIYLVDQPVKFWPRKSDLVLVSGILAPLAALTSWSGRDNVYVSRRGAQRSPRGEELLEKCLAEVGFDVMRMEDLSIFEQLAMARTSSLLVGFHGAGLVSCVMMRPGSTVIELSSGDRFESCYRRIAEMLGLEYRYVLVPGTVDDPFGVIDDEVVQSVFSTVHDFQ